MRFTTAVSLLKALMLACFAAPAVPAGHGTPERPSSTVGSPPSAVPTRPAESALSTTPAPPVAGTSPRASVNDFVARTYDDGRGHTLPYRLFIPRGYDPNKTYPLVVFLHGSGGRGTDNVKQITDQSAPLVFVQPENQARWPAFMLVPQCPPKQQWVDMPWATPTGKGKRPATPTWPMAAAMELVDQLRAEIPAIDAQRLFVTGMSMGGFGAWDAAVRHPRKWKAAVIVCGGYDEMTVAPILRIPIWAFHAADDPTVPVGRSRDMITALRSLGGQPRYTEYPASQRHGHFSWKPAYADPDLLPWMFGAPDARSAQPGTATIGDR